jgi:DNA-binding transcriptional regulator YhcF (GntR family)
VFILNPQSGTPIYRQLLEQVRRLVASGRLAPGDELPSVRELAVEHAVNPMTISKAYALLEAEGLLERNRGKPMTVAARPRSQAALRERLRRLDREAEQLVLAAKQLELAKSDVLDLIDKKWGDEHVASGRQRTGA